MPLYEYKCQECSSLSEFRMKMSDPHPTTCPECGGGPLSKMLSQTAFVLKGGGWYSEGYDGQSNKKPTKDSSSSDSAAAQTDTSKPSSSSDSSSSDSSSSSKSAAKTSSSTTSSAKQAASS